MFQPSYRSIALLLLLLAPAMVHAQLNAIAGYNIASLRSTNINHLIQSFNTVQSDNALPLKDVNLLHGFVAGFRYSYDLGAMEFTFKKNFTRRIGDFYNIPDPDSETQSKTRTNLDLFYDIRTLSLNTEFGTGVIFGGSLDYNVVKYELDYDNSKFRDFKTAQNRWGSRLFVGLHLANTQRISFSIRGYYQWLWKDLSLDSLRDELGLDADVCDPCREQPHLFGLSILINNGLQR